ncbi:MAG: Uma2 family endonuclease [Dolichospermum sp. DET50]|nr:Uma2 family endonuclease [Dolichospermum sp. DET66]MBS3032887.1 Uma2 family endonuclease [Dolichospermum sp. DET67]MBS3038092.1 Uma2 family endonuclease [Dolichospermum sp. DET50]QSX69998.1 MAG: Uma2 family endonuclease [Dolichospermum sp. DET69]
MVQALPQIKLVTFEEFIEWYPNTGIRYELHDGVIVEMTPPGGDHEEIVGFLVGEIVTQYKQLKFPYFIPKTALIKPPNSKSAYSPDILLLNRSNLVNEPLWKKQSTISESASVPIVVEIVSTNWRDDYYKKLADYEQMGIVEYWIVDYAALGGRTFIGNPKQPTISIYHLIDEEYQVSQFRDDDLIISPTFPHLHLTANQIFKAGV